MLDKNVLALAILEAIEEPALIVEAGLVTAANGHARQLLGGQMVGRDLRLAIRHPRTRHDFGRAESRTRRD